MASSRRKLRSTSSSNPMEKNAKDKLKGSAISCKLMLSNLRENQELGRRIKGFELEEKGSLRKIDTEVKVIRDFRERLKTTSSFEEKKRLVMEDRRSRALSQQRAINEVHMHLVKTWNPLGVYRETKIGFTKESDYTQGKDNEQNDGGTEKLENDVSQEEDKRECSPTNLNAQAVQFSDFQSNKNSNLFSLQGSISEESKNEEAGLKSKHDTKSKSCMNEDVQRIVSKEDIELHIPDIQPLVEASEGHYTVIQTDKDVSSLLPLAKDDRRNETRRKISTVHIAGVEDTDSIRRMRRSGRRAASEGFIQPIRGRSRTYTDVTSVYPIGEHDVIPKHMISHLNKQVEELLDGLDHNASTGTGRQGNDKSQFGIQANAKLGEHKLLAQRRASLASMPPSGSSCREYFVGRLGNDVSRLGNDVRKAGKRHTRRGTAWTEHKQNDNKITLSTAKVIKAHSEVQFQTTGSPKVLESPSGYASDRRRFSADVVCSAIAPLGTSLLKAHLRSVNPFGERTEKKI